MVLIDPFFFRSARRRRGEKASLQDEVDQTFFFPSPSPFSQILMDWSRFFVIFVATAAAAKTATLTKSLDGL